MFSVSELGRELIEPAITSLVCRGDDPALEVGEVFDKAVKSRPDSQFLWLRGKSFDPDFLAERLLELLGVSSIRDEDAQILVWVVE